MAVATLNKVQDSGALILPIAARELAVATRKRSTFWIRVAAAISAVIIGAGFLFIESLSGGNAMQMGKVLFNLLTVLSLGAALLAGPLFTSDAISEEKREGTLGFLFLTDLRGHDVVAGKLAASSIRVFYAMLSLIPVLGISLLMGGISGAQFWRTNLALLLALLCSLLVGLTVSSLSRHAARAIGRTVGWLLVWLVAPFIVGSGLRSANLGSWSELAWCLSPLFTLSAASTGRMFWESWFLVACVCGLLFALASYWTAHRWQDQEQTRTRRKAKPLPADASAPLAAPARTVFRRDLLEPNPIVWLSCREGWRTRNALLVTFILLLLIIAGLALFDHRFVGAAWGGLFGLISMLLYLWAASRSSRLLSQLRQSGMLELLMATPLTGREIVAGQWKGLLKMFWLPLLFLSLAHVLGATLSMRVSWAVWTQNPAGAAMDILASLLAAVLSCAALLANLAALAWFGAYAGLTSKTAAAAMLKTLVFVQILPWFVISFASGIVTAVVMLPLVAKGGGIAMLPANLLGVFALTAVPPLLILAKDYFFIRWARGKLFREFRILAVPQNTFRTLAPVSSPAPQTPPGTPPVIANP